MDNRDNDAKLVVNELLVEIFNHILPMEEKYMKRLGVELTITEIHILESVLISESKTMSAIAKKQRVTAGTLTVGVDKLVRKGYLVKVRNTVDKRVVTLELTKKAMDSLAIHEEFHNQLVNACVEGLELEKEKEIVIGLKKISDFFKDGMEKYTDIGD